MAKNILSNHERSYPIIIGLFVILGLNPSPAYAQVLPATPTPAPVLPATPVPEPVLPATPTPAPVLPATPVPVTPVAPIAPTPVVVAPTPVVTPAVTAFTVPTLTPVVTPTPIVTPPAIAPLPTCTFSASPSSLPVGGGTPTLSWTTTNATSITIDNGIGSMYQIPDGGTAISVTKTATYHLTATGPGGSVQCATTITVATLPAPTCTLLASPASIASGGTTTLSWTTTGASTFSLDHGIGAQTSTTTGSVASGAITADTTFTGTATNAAGVTATCTAAVTVATGGGGGGGGGGSAGPSCTLLASPTSVASGSTATLSWTTANTSSFTIDNGVGVVSPTAGGSTTTPAITANTTFTGTASDGVGNTATCTAAVTLPGGGGGSGGGGSTGGAVYGGGTGGAYSTPTVTVSTLPHLGAQPLAYLYLSQIPYTGLDLGPVGTVVYWLVLTLVSFVLAYFILFGLLPFTNGSRRDFVQWITGHIHSYRLAAATATIQEYRPVTAPAPAPEPEPYVAPVTAAAPTAVESPVAEVAEIQEASRGYSTFDGFKSFAQKEALSIEDIVKGLSRQPVSVAPSMAAPEVASPTPAPEPVVVAAPVVERKAVLESVEAPADVRGLAVAIIEKDRPAVFAGLRQHVRGGGKPEQLVSSVAFLFDDVYRARIDGSHCDTLLAERIAQVDTPALEKLVGALATAIDSSYTDGVTGAKMAFTRALAALGV